MITLAERWSDTRVEPASATNALAHSPVSPAAGSATAEQHVASDPAARIVDQY
jgi:hypothetical protein